MLELVSSVASMSSVSVSSARDTLNALSVIAAFSSSSVSRVLFLGSGVMVYSVPFIATPRAAVAFGDAKTTAALLNDVRVIMPSTGFRRLVSGLVSEAIVVPSGMSVPSTPVQRMR